MTGRDKVELSDDELELVYERLSAGFGRGAEMAPLPEGWGETLTGEPLPSVVAAVRRSRGLP
jgi:hypothetical protein